LEKGTTPSWTGAEKSEFRDAVNVIGLMVDNEIIGTVHTTIGILKMVPGSAAKLNLRATGDIVIKAGDQKNLYAAESKKASIPVAIYGENAARLLKAGNAGVKIASDVAKLVSAGKALGGKIEPAMEKL
jgi:hypothetical protein